ncbi:hypothetical protein BV22DRAFT_1028258 [Leucogyrophana mollusca]|uniref:Uncharacterized protein n=1 Tax=Leucogyrophana mollusca TaxID=85980 RepID=A0ACB8BYK8_9AGAM|nr:hypothetical protein BV22DRAFT_1028258 [Leucogyrophana mollusca]
MRYPSPRPARVPFPETPELTQEAKASVAPQEDGHISKQDRDTDNDYGEELRRMKDELDKQQEENSTGPVDRDLTSPVPPYHP